MTRILSYLIITTIVNINNEFDESVSNKMIENLAKF